jgi:hypothetical protein
MEGRKEFGHAALTRRRIPFAPFSISWPRHASQQKDILSLDGEKTSLQGMTHGTLSMSFLDLKNRSDKNKMSVE